MNTEGIDTIHEEDSYENQDSEQGSSGDTPRPSNAADNTTADLENPYGGNGGVNILNMSISRFSSNLEVYDDLLLQSSPMEKVQ